MSPTGETPAETDARLLRRTFALARFARNRANGPYGALCARAGRVAAEGENTEQEEDGDLTCHAEMNALRQASRELSAQDLAQLTLYASAEPCPMCCGAIALAGIGRLVYGASSARVARLTGRTALDCRLILAPAGVEVVGPMLEEEALAVWR
jgi:tRNA(Arg) A34 adenosine deaminase TadA